MADDPLRPPPGLTPGTFFTSWLPEAFVAAGRSGLLNAPAVRVTLSGAGGGDWWVRAGEEGLVVTPLAAARRDDVDVWLRQSVSDFTAAFTPDADLPELLPPGWTALDLLFSDERDVALLDQMSGRILFEVLGKRRRRWALDLAFAKEGVTAGRARATIQIDGATYDGLRLRTVAPMQALLGGKVKIDGDRPLAMKAIMLVASRLSRSW